MQVIELRDKHEGVESVDIEEMENFLANSEIANRESDQAQADLNSGIGQAEAMTREIAQLEDILAAKKTQREEQDARNGKLAKTIVEHIDTAEVKEDIAIAREINRQVAENEQTNVMIEESVAMLIEIDEVGEKLEAISDEWRQTVADANLGVDGLTFDEDAIRYNHVPLDQCATSEAIRVSTALGLAAHPDLNVMLIKDGSLLDADSQAVIEDLAEREQAQVWIERVGEDQAPGAFIFREGQLVS